MEEKLKKAEDKKRREEERQRRREEKLKKEAEKQGGKGKTNIEREGKQEYEWKIEDEIPDFVDAWAEHHYWWDDRDIIDGWDIIFNPKYEHVPVKDPRFSGDENNIVSKGWGLKKEVGTLKGEMKVEENTQKNKENGQRKEPKQLKIPFEYED